jgi:class 3 adenylate cyclase
VPFPLPADPLLAAHAKALNEAGYWGFVFDASWRVVYVTDDFVRSVPSFRDFAVPGGCFYWGPEGLSAARDLPASVVDTFREQFRSDFPDVLAATQGGRTALRELVDPCLRDLVDELPDAEALPAHSNQRNASRAWGMNLGVWSTGIQVRDASGRLAGIVRLTKHAAGMAITQSLTAGVDLRHFERMQDVITADRRPAAILFADLEASSPLARRLSTADYFDLARRLVRAADQCVVDAGGLVGRHLGDGVTAFFLAEVLGSESAAARAAIDATRALRHAAVDIAERSGLAPDDVVLRFGLHWGATLYVGLIKSVARAEVTALGDEVNEAARIEACASGGRALASKALVERLNRTDLDALDLERVNYTPLGELATATDKARRDAPAIAVCDV